MKSRADAFRARAEIEAERYGPDPWVFVRELVQNARDAGASRVDIQCGLRDGYPTVLVRDDGEGMAWEDAQRYLFSLYTSSKEGASDKIGCFGVGFWSILRARPVEIVVRSRSATSAAWGVVLRGDLEQATREDLPHPLGTTVELTLPPQADISRRVKDAALQNVRFVTMRSSDAPLKVFVDGEAVHRPFALPAPSVEFRARGLRGVVALAATPGVELFSRGLRVRAASSVRDLAGAGSTTKSRVRFAEVPGALAPKVLLDSARLALPLSRNDAKDDRELRAVIERAELEISRLVEGQLDRLRPPSLWDRATRWSRSVSSLSWPMRATIGLLTGIAIGAFALVTPSLLGYQWMGRGSSSSTQQSGARSIDGPGGPQPGGAASAAGAREPPRAYHDLAGRYAGPSASLLENAVRDGAVDLGYVPSRDSIHFAVLYPDLSPSASTPEDRIIAREDWLCRHDCVEVDLSVDADAGVLSLPLPPGHRVDSHSVRIDADSLTPLATADGRWVVMLPAPRHGRLRYRTGPDASMPAPPARAGQLPAELVRWVELTADLTTEERVAALEDAVRKRIRYETGSEIVAAYAQPELQDLSPIERALAVGAGDCDLQNAMLTELLRGARIPARLAVGWVGVRGRAVPVLHAWTEWVDDRGHWRTADASVELRSGSVSPRTLGDSDTSEVDASQSSTSPLNAGSAAVSRAGSSPATPATSDGVEGANPWGQAKSSRHDPPTRTQPGDPVDSAPRTGAAGGREDRFAGLRKQASLRDALAWRKRGSANDRNDSTSQESDAHWWRSLRPLGADPVQIGWLAILVSTISLCVLALALLIRRRKDSSAMNLDHGAELVEILHGALTQPAAFARVPSIFERRLIPCLGGSAISIRMARQYASSGRLACAKRGQLSMAALRHSDRIVIDLDTPEGRRAALHLGAFDLDVFRELWERAEGSAVLERVERELARAGQPTQLRISAVAARPLSVCPLSTVDAASGRAAHRTLCALIDSNAPLLQRARAIQDERPAFAAFMIAEFVLARAPEFVDAEESTLQALGRQAVAEADQGRRNGARTEGRT